MDLLETTKDVILHYICPRLDPDYLEVSYSPPGDGMATEANNHDSLKALWISPPTLTVCNP